MNKKDAIADLCENQKCEICTLENTIANEWFLLCKDEMSKDYFAYLKQKLHSKTFSPKTELIFSFTRFFSPQDTKVVLIGQEPYTNAQLANGLAFSSTKMTSSLRNIFKDIKKCYPEYEIPKHGDLTNWVKQGVLLLNANLTTWTNKKEKNEDLWIKFTKFIVNQVSVNGNVVFLLCGKSAQKFVKDIENNNLILLSSHPSAKGVRKEFGGENHFKIANEYLINHNKLPIYW